jgi:glycine cleavage system aminomethyltransferase T
VTGALPQLLDCRGLMAELGVKRATAEAIMRAVPSVDVPGLRKMYVRRDDVQAFLEQHTSTDVTRRPRVTV